MELDQAQMACVCIQERDEVRGGRPGYRPVERERDVVVNDDNWNGVEREKGSWRWGGLGISG